MDHQSSIINHQSEGLLEVLDEDIRHLEQTLSSLDALRSLLIKRREADLEELLGAIRRQAEAYRPNEQKRRQLRQDLAADLGCDPGAVTLSRLQGELTEPLRTALAQRQVRLRSLAARLKQEYTLTVLLLRDCSRLNRSLLQALCGTAGRGGATYTPSGAARPPVAATLMSTQL